MPNHGTRQVGWPCTPIAGVALSFACAVGGCALDSAGTGESAVDSSIPFRDTGVADDTAATADAAVDDVALDAPAEVSLDADGASPPPDVPDDTPPLTCNAGELSFGKHCYSVDLGGSTFLEARGVCAGLGLTGHLVTINSYEEDTFVSSITIGLEAWMGLARDPVSNPRLRSSFKWITGEPVGVDAWRGSEPDATGQCARHTGTGWADSDCGERFAAICERE